MKVASAELFSYRLPLHEPLHLAGQTIHHREGLILRLEAENGAQGFGEIAPLPGFSRETLEEARGICSGWLRPLRESSVPVYPIDIAGGEAAWNLLPPSVQFGVSCAAATLKASALGTDHDGLFPGPTRDSVALNALLIGTGDACVAAALDAKDDGYSAVKIKVGRGVLDEEAETVIAVREAVGPDMAIRLDANRAWSFQEAERFMTRVRDAKIEYIEEPSDYWKLFFSLRLYARTPYAVDETLQDFRRVFHEGGHAQPGEPEEHQHLRQALKRASAHIIKPTLIGGLRHVSRFVNECTVPWGATAVISSSFESGLGLALLANLAATLPIGDTPIGLDTHRWFAEDVLPEPLPIYGGALDIGQASELVHRIEFGKLDCIAIE